MPVSAQATSARLPASRTMRAITKLPKVPGGRNTTWPSTRCGAIARAMSACAIAGDGIDDQFGAAQRRADVGRGAAIGTSRAPSASFSTMLGRAPSAGCSAIAAPQAHFVAGFGESAAAA